MNKSKVFYLDSAERTIEKPFYEQHWFKAFGRLVSSFIERISKYYWRIEASSPGKLNGCVRALDKLSHTPPEIPTICLIIEDIALFNSTHHHMMQCSGDIQPRRLGILFSNLKTLLLEYNNLFNSINYLPHFIAGRVNIAWLIHILQAKMTFEMLPMMRMNLIVSSVSISCDSSSGRLLEKGQYEHLKLHLRVR